MAYRHSDVTETLPALVRAANVLHVPDTDRWAIYGGRPSSSVTHYYLVSVDPATGGHTTIHHLGGTTREAYRAIVAMLEGFYIAARALEMVL